MKTETCKKCSCIITNGKHPKTFMPLTADVLSQLIKLKCSSCGSEVSLATIKKQGIKNWRNLTWTGSCFCPGCSHQLDLGKE